MGNGLLNRLLSSSPPLPIRAVVLLDLVQGATAEQAWATSATPGHSVEGSARTGRSDHDLDQFSRKPMIE